MPDFCGAGHILIRLRETIAPPETTLDWPLQPIASPLNHIRETIAAYTGRIPVVLEQATGREIIGLASKEALDPLKHLCIADLRPECPCCDAVACAVAGRCDTCAKPRCQHRPLAIDNKDRAVAKC